MHFHLTEEQTAIQDAVRGTLADSWPMERIHAFADGDADFDGDSWQAMMALGLGGILLPDSGMGLLDAALVCEVAGEAAAAGPLIGQLLAVAAIARSENEAAKAHLEGLSSGTTVATLAFTAGDPAEAELMVPCARSAQLFLIGSRTGGIALVEAGDAVTIAPVASTDRSRPVSKVTFAGATMLQLFAPEDPMTAKLYAAALVLAAADALGGAQKVTDMSVAYAKEREQFGQPIGRFQGLKHQLAHMALDVEPARALRGHGESASVRRLCPRHTRRGRRAWRDRIYMGIWSQLLVPPCRVRSRLARQPVDATRPRGEIGGMVIYGCFLSCPRSLARRMVLATGRSASRSARPLCIAPRTGLAGRRFDKSRRSDARALGRRCRVGRADGRRTGSARRA
jgi:alkylation response protein AidB-like acyl-CoA dehydrogenase